MSPNASLMPINHWLLDNKAACGAEVAVVLHCAALDFIALRHAKPDQHCARCFVAAEQCLDPDRYAENLTDWSHR